MADLQERTGLTITRVEVGRIDFTRDTARLKVYYQNGHDYDEDFEYLDRVKLVEA